MQLSDMKSLLELYVDDIVPIETVVLLLNAGQNRMAMEVKAKFPQLTQNLADTFVFDSKFHEGPILYAAAMIKAQDSSIREKESFILQFTNLLSEFSENYIVIPRYRDDEISQQFTATAGQTDFTITRSTYSPQYSALRVYVNDIALPDSAYSASSDDNTFSLVTPTAANDAVTALWEQHSDLMDAPIYWPGW
jgi:hypothetical protein